MLAPARSERLPTAPQRPRPDAENSGGEVSWRLRPKRWRRRLFAFDIGRLDDRPPLLDFGLLESAERVGRLLVAWRTFLDYVSEPLLHCRVAKASTAAELSSAMMSFGVAFGTQSPCQIVM